MHLSDDERLNLYDDAEKALLEAISSVSRLDGDDNVATYQERASAARQFAEALECVTSTRGQMVPDVAMIG